MSDFLKTVGVSAANLTETIPAESLISHPIIHLAIDVQREFIGDLRPGRKEYYPKQVDKFRNDLRERNIPTIHVGFGSSRGAVEDIELVPRTAEWRMSRPEFREKSRQISDLEFMVKPYKDEDIVIKHRPDAFAMTTQFLPVPSLAGILKRQGARTIIMTGGNTTACVLESAASALNSEFNLILVYDRVADESAPKQESDPLWHKEQLSELFPDVSPTQPRIRRSPPSLQLVTALECLDLVAVQNNRPAQKTAPSLLRSSLG